MREYVESRKGSYYVSGTRVSLDSLVYAFRRGDSPETTRHNFDVLSLEEVYGAITWYLANQAEVESYLVRQRQAAETDRRNAAPPTEELRARLSATQREAQVPRSQ